MVRVGAASDEPHENDDWHDWAKDEIFFSKDEIPKREDKEAKIDRRTATREAIMTKLGFQSDSLEKKRDEVMNDLGAYDTNSEADETFRRDFYEQAVDELKQSLELDRVQGGGDVDLRDLNNFVEYVHTSGSETLESDKNSYIEGAHNPLRVRGEAEGLNVVRTAHENLDLALEDVESGVLYAISGDDLTADLPDLEGYSDVYLISTHGDVRVDADEVGPGAHLYAESIHGDARVSVDEVDEDGMVYVNSTHGESYLRGAEMEEDNVSATSIHGEVH